MEGTHTFAAVEAMAVADKAELRDTRVRVAWNAPTARLVDLNQAPYVSAL